MTTYLAKTKYLGDSTLDRYWILCNSNAQSNWSGPCGSIRCIISPLINSIFWIHSIYKLSIRPKLIIFLVLKFLVVYKLFTIRIRLKGAFSYSGIYI